MRIITEKDRVVVKGVNIRARHMKPTQANPQGGIIRSEMPIHKSNVSPGRRRQAVAGSLRNEERWLKGPCRRSRRQ